MSPKSSSSFLRQQQEFVADLLREMVNFLHLPSPCQCLPLIYVGQSKMESSAPKLNWSGGKETQYEKGFILWDVFSPGCPRVFSSLHTMEKWKAAVIEVSCRSCWLFAKGFFLQAVRPPPSGREAPHLPQPRQSFLSKYRGANAGETRGIFNESKDSMMAFGISASCRSAHWVGLVVILLYIHGFGRFCRILFKRYPNATQSFVSVLAIKAKKMRCTKKTAPKNITGETHAAGHEKKKGRKSEFWVCWPCFGGLSDPGASSCTKGRSEGSRELQSHFHDDSSKALRFCYSRKLLLPSPGWYLTPEQMDTDFRWAEHAQPHRHLQETLLLWLL